MSHGRYPSTDNELMLYRVLQRANLVQYYEAFVSQGGDDVNQLCEAGEEEFLEIMALVGMASKPLHVRRLQKALLEWIVEPGLFSKPIQDRRVSPAMVSKGSIYATIQQPDSRSQPSSRVVNGNSISTPGGDTVGHMSGGGIVDERGLQQSVSHGGHSALPLNHQRATPNSDDTSDPDAMSNTSFDAIRNSGVSPTMYNSITALALLNDEQIAVIAAAVDSMAKTLPPYAPKPLNMKKPIDKEIQEAMTCLEEDPTRLDISRRYSAIYGRFDSKRPPYKQMNFHEVCVNEAAAHLCRHRPSLLTRRDDLYNLALRIVRDNGFQSLRTGPPVTAYGGSSSALLSSLASAQSTATTAAAGPPLAKQPRLDSTSSDLSASNNSTMPAVREPSLLRTDEQDSIDNSVCSIVDDGPSTDDILVTLDSDPPSLVDEGLRIARQYGLGAEFESELQDLKKATTAAATASATATAQEDPPLVAEESMESSSSWNHGAGMADDVDQDKLTT